MPIRLSASRGKGIISACDYCGPFWNNIAYWLLTSEGELNSINIFVYSLQTLIYLTCQGFYLDKK